MVTSPELPWQDSADSNFPANLHRQYWQQAVVQVTENLIPHAGPRLTKALKLVLANAVTIRDDGIAQVQSDNRAYSITPDAGCACEDARRRTRFCKHTLAVLIHQRATALLRDTQHSNKQEPPKATTASRNAGFATWQIHEAPVCCTMTFVCHGVNIHLTMRDVSDDALFARVRRVLLKIQQKSQTSAKDDQP
jgi:hypothetical protein